MEERYKALRESIDRFNKEMRELEKRKPDEEIILKDIERVIGYMTKKPRYVNKKIRWSSRDFNSDECGVYLEGTGMEVENKALFRIFLFIYNPDISLKAIDECLSRVGLNNLSSIEHVDKLNIVISGMTDDGFLINGTEEYFQLGLSEDMLWYNIKNALISLNNLIVFKNFLLDLAMETAKNGSKNILFKEKFNDIYDKTIRKCVEDLNNYLNIIKYYNRKQPLAISATNKLVEMMEDGELDEVTDFDEDFVNLDDDVLYEFLKIINDNIKRIYGGVSTELSDIHNEYEKTYIRRHLFLQGFDYKSVSEEILGKIDKLDDTFVKRVVNIFVYAGVDCYDMLYKYNSLFETLDDNSLELLEELIVEKILTPSTLLGYLIDLDKKISLIRVNYDILKGCIDFKNEYFDDNLLFGDSRKLRDNILVLSFYTINKYIYTYLLGNIDKLYILDIMIEKKIPLYLFMEIADNSNPNLVIEKIVISKEIGKGYCNNKGELKKDVSDADRFLVPDNEIEGYLCNCNSLANNICIDGMKITWELVDVMDKLYQKDNNAYLIDGFRFSRPKFIRNISVGYDKFPALICGSIISYTEMLQIEDSLSKKGVNIRR